MRTLPAVCTADISLLVPEQKVVDTHGVPIMVAAVLVYRICDAQKAVLDMDDVHRYVRAQAAAALKLTVSKYSYEELKVESAPVQEQVATLLQAKCDIAGAEVVSVTLAELNYAPEIAQAMLKKQQAAALVQARELVVEGACSICMDAVKRLEAAGMTLEQADKVRIVTNLLTVVCGEVARRRLEPARGAASSPQRAACAGSVCRAVADSSAVRVARPAVCACRRMHRPSSLSPPREAREPSAGMCAEEQRSWSVPAELAVVARVSLGPVFGPLGGAFQLEDAGGHFGRRRPER